MNALLTDWTGPFGLPPFDAITDGDFGPAFAAALAEARANVAAIAASAEVPTFANVIEALELAEEALSRVGGVFYNVAGADSTPAREDLERDLAPKMSAFGSEVTNNKALFQRIEAVWAGREGLAGEQLRVLTLYRRMFVRAGALLEGDAAARLTAVKSPSVIASNGGNPNGPVQSVKSAFMPIPLLVRLHLQPPFKPPQDQA